jgi:nucleotidyltransferase/DNA polymerase involved in DNA repair
MSKKSSAKHELRSLMNVGPATQEDLFLLGITTIEQLARANPDELYERLQKITEKQHDPCVWNIFAAIIHEAKTGEKTRWWDWSSIRKARKH